LKKYLKHTPYSFSKLNTHHQCNRRFKYQYLLKLPQEKTDRTSLLKGSAIHSILEHYPSKSTHKLASKYQHIVDLFVQTKIGKKYLNATSTRELKLAFSNDLNSVSYFDKTALFRGAVDLLTVIDEILHICDYKTGKYKEQKWQNYDQLMFYAIYFFNVYPKINTIKLSYIYVEHDLENELTLTREHLVNYTSELFSKIKAAETDETFEKNISKLCDWCPYRTACSENVK